MAETQTTQLDQIMQSYIDSGQYSESELSEIRKREANKLKESTRETSWWKGEEGFIPDEFQSNVNRPRVAEQPSEEPDKEPDDEELFWKADSSLPTIGSVYQAYEDSGKFSESELDYIKKRDAENKMPTALYKWTYGAFGEGYSNTEERREEIKEEQQDENSRYNDSLHAKELGVLGVYDLKENSKAYEGQINVKGFFDLIGQEESEKGVEEVKETDRTNPYYYGFRGNLQALGMGDNAVTDFVADHLSSMYRSLAVVGVRQADGTVAGWDVMSSGKTASDEEIEALIDSVGEMPEQTDAVKQYSSRYEQIKEEEGGTMAFMVAVAENPTYIRDVALSSLGNMATSLVTSKDVALRAVGTGTASGLTNAVVAKYAKNPIGKGLAFLSGFMGGMSGSMDAGQSYSQFLQEQLEKDGKDFTPENIRALLNDEEVIEYIDPNGNTALNMSGTRQEIIKNRAIRRGIAIGTIDGLSTLVAGGTVGRTTGKLTTTTQRNIKASTQAVAGGLASEIGGQTFGGQEYDAGEILTEGIAEKGIATTGVTVMPTLLKKKGKYTIGNQEFNEKAFVEEINKMDDATLAAADVKVENDKVMDGLVKNRQGDAYLDSQVNGKVTDVKDRKEIVKKQKELYKAEQEAKAEKDRDDGDTSAAEKVAKIKSDIANIVGKYSGVDGRSADVRARNKAGKEIKKSRVKIYLKDTEQFAEVSSQQLDYDPYEAFDSNKDYVSAYVSRSMSGMDLSGMTQEQIEAEANRLANEANNSDGVNVVRDADGRGQIMINREVAAEYGAMNVGSHEVLHAVMEGAIQKMKPAERKVVIKQFKDQIKTNLGQNVVDLIEARLTNKDTYNMSQEEAATSSEWFNALSDIIEDKNNNITYKNNKGFFDKIKDNVASLFNKNTPYEKLSIETGEQAFNFMKEYSKSVKAGKLSESMVEFAGRDKSAAGSKFSKNQTDSVNELAEMGWDNKSWKAQGADFAIKEMQNNKMLDGLIRSKYKADIVPDNFIDLVYSELVSHVKNFKPEQNDNLFGWINSQIANKAGNVYNREFKVADEMKGAKDIGKTTKEGEVKVQVAAETDKAMEALETEDLSPAAQAKKKADKAKGKQKVESEFRRKIGIETNSDLYNKVLDSARKALLRAYEAGTSVRNIQRKLRDEANVYLFKSVKNFLGTKDYVKNLKKFREPIVKAIFTADLVQLERNVADSDRVLTTFVEKLTSKQEVESAVNQKLLPPSALNIIDKGTAVSVYKKKTPTEKQFLDFFYAPLVNPVTGSRSGLRGTRKDGLAKAMAGALSYDATMQVAQEQDVIEKREQLAALKGETLAQDNLETLSAAIGRDPNVNFSKSNENRIVSNMALEIVDLLAAMETNPTLVIKTKYGYKLNSASIIKRWTKRSKFAKSDEAIIAEFAYKTYRGNEYGKLTDVELQKKVLRDVIKSRKNKFELSTHQAFEQLIISSLQYANREAGNVLKTNKKVKEGVGEGDAYISRGRIIVGIEVKMNEADGVSQTVNPKEDGSVSFTNSNPTTNEKGVTYDSLIGDMISKATKALSKELGGIQNLKLTAEQMMTVANSVLKTKYLQVMDISAEYAMWHYGNGKYTNKPQGFIHVGESTYRMITGNPKIDNVSLAIAQEFKNKTGIKIPTLEVKSGQSMEMVARLKIDKKTGKLNWRISPRIVDKQLVNSKVNLLNRADAVNFMQAATTATSKFSKSKDGQTIGRAVQFSRSVNPAKGITVLDFDDTLATTKSLVKFTRPDGTTGTLNAEQYASTYENLLDQGYTFDFSDFNKVVKGKLAPLFNKAMKLQNKFGPKNMFVLTARPPQAQKAIFDFLKANGLNIPANNITGLGNSTAEAKALWMADKVGEGYNDFYFADDALQNVQAVKNMLDQFDVKSKVQQAKVNFSNSMNDQFNGILEDVTGINSQQEFSEAQASLLGRKAKYKSIIPASAQDFQGLLYNFLGKGKKGEADMAFFKKALIDPFARAIDELNASKQSAAVDFKNLNKSFPKIKKILNKKIEGSQYTNDQAIRVYLWGKAGFAVPGMTEQDIAELTSIVESNGEMQAYADVVGLISKRDDGYSKPKDYWLAENISSDLLSDGAIGDVRADFLAEWQQNVDQIFSKVNLNKIESIYGSKFREALEDSLYRMRTGRNRPTGGGRIMNMYMNWVNNSVGAIMFFNMRSAVLQTISATNYMNWSFNNPAKAALAFANQKQYWKDFTMIFNSPYLKQRRSGNQRGINEAEISDAVAGSQNKAKAAIAWLLKKGFLPTQLADSFAIASGGAAFFRNKVKALVKEGMTQEQAEAQAFIDFQEVTEVSQQSARPDMISQQQASPLGRLILSFQNTPMQYARIMNKAARDLVNGRGDTKTHMSKIAYYGVIQGIIFGALQSALFAADDAEEYDKKSRRIMNQMVDSVLSGIGYGGKAISTVKNTIVEYARQKDKGWNADHTYTILQLLGFSPPIGSKLRKIYSSIQTDKYNEGVYSKRGFTLDNPIWNAIGNVVEGVTNVPLGRLSNKMLNIDNALDEHHEWWQRAALLLGWNTWDLGIRDPDIEAIKNSNKKNKKNKKNNNKKTTKNTKNESVNKKKQQQERKKGKTVTCAAFSKSGNRCKKEVESGGSYCTIHAKVKQNKSGKKTQCKKIKSNKKRCKMKTSSSSGYCYYHD